MSNRTRRAARSAAIVARCPECSAMRRVVDIVDGRYVLAVCGHDVALHDIEGAR